MYEFGMLWFRGIQDCISCSRGEGFPDLMRSVCFVLVCFEGKCLNDWNGIDLCGKYTCVGLVLCSNDSTSTLACTQLYSYKAGYMNKQELSNTYLNLGRSLSQVFVWFLCQVCCRMARSLTLLETETSPSSSRSGDRKSSRAGRKESHRWDGIVLQQIVPLHLCTHDILC